MADDAVPRDRALRAPGVRIRNRPHARGSGFQPAELEGQALLVRTELDLQVGDDRPRWWGECWPSFPLFYLRRSGEVNGQPRVLHFLGKAAPPNPAGVNDLIENAVGIGGEFDAFGVEDDSPAAAELRPEVAEFQDDILPGALLWILRKRIGLLLEARVIPGEENHSEAGLARVVFEFLYDGAAAVWLLMQDGRPLPLGTVEELCHLVLQLVVVPVNDEDGIARWSGWSLRPSSTGVRINPREKLVWLFSKFLQKKREIPQTVICRDPLHR